MSDTDDLTQDQRETLISLLQYLPADAWDTPSLCRGWTVRDVAAHLAVAPSIGVGAALAGLARARFSVNRFIADSARAYARRGEAAILAQLEANAAERAAPLGMPPSAVLTDSVVHTADIARPLGLTWELRPEAFTRVADVLVGIHGPGGLPFRGSAVRSAARDRRLVADDLAWSHGDGPEVHAPAQVWLRLLAGRAVDPDEITGDGAPGLRDALAAG